MIHKNKYGWNPDLPDHRDFNFAVPHHVSTALPLTFDLRPKMPPVYDQQTIGSCVGHGVSAAFQYEAMKQGEVSYEKMIPSRMFAYYNARVEDGSLPISDSGASIRGGIKGVVDYGLCLANLWPYVIKKVNVKPNVNAFTKAVSHKSTAYYSVNQDVNSLKGAIAAGFPVVCGISVYDSFESDVAAKTGVIPMPARTENLLGGHCIVLVGYVTQGGVDYFVFRNSWGTSWGDAGYGYLPVAYILNSNLASDFWVIQTVA